MEVLFGFYRDKKQFAIKMVEHFTWPDNIISSLFVTHTLDPAAGYTRAHTPDFIDHFLLVSIIILAVGL